MKDILEYVVKDAYILIPVLYVLGVFLKRTPKVEDWKIPWILLVIGIVLAIPMVGDVVKGINQGILVTGIAVLSHQLVKQSIERD